MISNWYYGSYQVWNLRCCGPTPGRFATIANWSGSFYRWNVCSKSKDTCQEPPSGRPGLEEFWQQLNARKTLVELKRWFRDRKFNPQDSGDDSDDSDYKWLPELSDYREWELEDDSSQESSQESSDKSLEDL